MQFDPIYKERGNNTKGFLCSGVSAGIKPNGDLDMALIYSEVLANAAGVFTFHDLFQYLKKAKKNDKLNELVIFFCLFKILE